MPSSIFIHPAVWPQ